ncbi:MAG: radical SAM/SPASM domain-containing protein [Candidatus Sumerlaeia bacterium]
MSFTIPIHEDHIHYALRCARHPLKALGGYRKLRHLPGYVWVEITKRCNLRCRSCEKRYGLGDSESEMPLGLFEKILTRIGPYVSDVNITGVGEPFFHKDAKKILGMLAAFPNINTELTTNGQLMDEDWLQQLSRMRCIVAFSVDGTSQESFSFNRPGADVEKLRWALARARELELAAPDPNQFLFRRKINFLVMRETMDEIPEIVQWASDYNVIDLSLNLMNNWGAPSDFWKEQNPLNYRKELRARIEEARELAREKGVNLTAPDVAPEATPEMEIHENHEAKGILKYFKADQMTREGYPRFEDRFCDFPFRTMYFHVNGDASVCCAAQWHPSRLGNLKKRSLPRIWNSLRSRRVRSGMLIGSHTPYCRSCPLPNGLGRGNPRG